MDDQFYLDRTLVVLEKLTRLVVKWISVGVMRETTLWGIEIVNEPVGWEEKLWINLRDRYHNNGFILTVIFL